MSRAPVPSKFDRLIPLLVALDAGERVRVPDALIPASPGNARYSLTKWINRKSLPGFRVQTERGSVFITRGRVGKTGTKAKVSAIRIRAIRGAWAVARRAGIEPPAADWPGRKGLMSTDENVRFAMVRAWEAGYRRGRADR